MDHDQYNRVPDIVLWFDEYYVDENLDTIDELRRGDKI